MTKRLVFSVFLVALVSGCSPAKKEVGPFQYVRAGDSYLDRRDYKNAVKNFEKAYAILPENEKIRESLVYGYLEYANSLWEGGDLEGAIPLLEKAFDAGRYKYGAARNLAGAYAQKASVLISEGKYADALDYMRRENLISRKSPELKKRLAVILFNNAIDAYNKGDFKSASLFLIESNRLDSDRKTLELIGDIYYRRSGFDLAIYYWNLARGKAGGDTAKLDEKIKKATDELELEKSLASFEAANFVVKLEGGLELNVAEIGPILEEAYRIVGADFDFYPPRRTEVLLYSQETFREIFKQPVVVRAFYDGKIRMPLENGVSSPDALRRLIIHEYAHAAIFTVTNNNCPVWFSEALALYEESHVAEIPTDAFRALFLGKKDFGLADIEKGFEEGRPDGLIVYYQGAYTVARFIVDRWGLQRLDAILERLKEKRHIFNAMEDVLPFSMGEFENQWREYVRENI